MLSYFHSFPPILAWRFWNVRDCVHTTIPIPGRLGSSARNSKRLVDFGAKRWIVWSLEYTVFVPIEWRWKKYCVLFTEYVNLCLTQCTRIYFMFLNLNTLHFKMTFAIICPNQDFPFNMTTHNISHKSQHVSLVKQCQVAKENVKSGRFFTRKKHESHEWGSASPHWPWSAGWHFYLSQFKQRMSIGQSSGVLMCCPNTLYNVVNIVKSVLHKLW